mgnify:FL=1
MKSHLKEIKRTFDYTDKSQYDYVLNQSERNEKISNVLFEIFKKQLKQEDFMYYPNTKNFKEKICKFYNVKTENLFLSDGSDVGIKSIFETFTTYDRIITSEPSFPMYKVYSELYQCEYFGIPHEKDYTISMEKILSNITHDTNLVILANPNSPMGEYKSFDEIRTLLEQDVMVLIDEAYIEFTDNESMIQYIDEYPNLLVTRTFSKGFGAAGCRVGMTFGHKDTIELLSKFRQMYEITGVSLKYCEFLLNNYKLVDTYIQEVKEEKKKLVSMLKGYDVIDSNCNWIHFNTTDDNLKTKQIFDKHKVLVKYCELPHDDRKNWCRLTIQPKLSEQQFIKELL